MQYDDTEMRNFDLIRFISREYREESIALSSATNSAVTAEDRKRALVDVVNIATSPDKDLVDKKQIM